MDKEVEVLDYTPLDENKNTFEYGDLFIECSCGANYSIGEGFKNGISLFMPTKKDAFWKLVCSECKHSMTLYMKPSSEETILQVKEKEKENESVQQADSEEMDNSGISENTELYVDSYTQGDRSIESDN